MKKTILTLSAFFTFGLTVQAQVLLEQDFQGFANGGEIPFIAEPDDAEEGDWISYDEDGLEDGSTGSTTRPGNWYGSLDFRYFENEEIVDTNFVMASSSWMDGFAPGNRNWLITPEIEITGPAVLSWKSAPFQTPRYADGYSVWVSPDGSMLEPGSDFSDKLYTEAQMVSSDSWNQDYYGDIDYSGCSAPTDPNATDVCWFPETYGTGTDGTSGYRHAANVTDMDYIGIDPDADNPQNYTGFLEPHTIDLSAYVGQTIRIAWLHDSDDDNLISVDDILVEIPTGLADIPFKDIVGMYPNPATEVLNLDFTSFVKQEAVVTIYDVNGKAVVSERYAGPQLANTHRLDISDLAPGIYNVQVVVDQQETISQNFLKK